MTTTSFIQRARAVHGDRYDYSLTDCFEWRRKITIICPEHGIFHQKVSNHLAKSGCPKCGMERAKALGALHGTKALKTTDQFIAEARTVHGDRYDYTQAVYTGIADHLAIICSKHGPFSTTAEIHLKGHNCPKCGRLRPSQRITIERFEERSRSIHGSRYRYISMKHSEGKASVAIIECHQHGRFERTALSHINKRRGCPKCFLESIVHNTESFISKAKALHGNLYDYSRVKYTSTDTDVIIGCPRHGFFKQTPAVHHQLGKGAGCPRCHDEDCTSSSQEKALRKWLESVAVVYPNTRKILGNYEIDAWLPEHRIGVEFHGLYWHSEKHKSPKAHQEKWKLARQNNIRLIQIFEDEWWLQNDVVKSLILAKLGKSPHRIFARQCNISKISWAEGRSFFSNNHLQGADSSSLYYGLFHNGKLVSCLSFTRSGEVAKIQRFASLIFHSIPGGFSKLLTCFIRESPEIREIETFANLRYSGGEVYKANGFKECGITAPGYFYVKMKTNPIRESRQKYQVHKLKKQGYCGTERSITESLKLVRVYDAGHMKLSLNL